MYNREYTPDRITELHDNEIFVFGSNLRGAHGGGAARLAYERFGALWGQGTGLQGRSYAIPTMQGGVETIKPYVDDFIEFAFIHPELKFLVTRIGCGIAAFTPEEIAPLFEEALNYDNVILPKDFVEVIAKGQKVTGSVVTWNAEKDFLCAYRDLMAKVKDGDQQAYYQVKELRAKEFRNTVEIVNQGFYTSESGWKYAFPTDEEMMSKTAFYEYESRVLNSIHAAYQTSVEVLNMDCLQAAIQLQERGYNPAVLNMASRRNPGGGVTTGAGAQEETLFRRTNLFRSLYQFAPYARQYGITPSPFQYPLERNFGGIYTPDAICFREDEQQGYALMVRPVTLSFITVAGMNHPDLTPDGMIEDHHVEPIKNKIRTIFRLGLNHGHDSLVLGALGCGAFRNPPRHIARLFHEVMDEPEFVGKYRHIVFAILDDHNAHRSHNPEGNFKPFSEEFKEKKMNYLSYPNSQVLWAEFYGGYSDPEKYIEDMVDDFRAHGRNPEKTDSWEKAAREWLVSEYYEKDRALFKQLYDRIIDLFEADIVETFDIQLPAWDMGYDDLEIVLNMNEEKIDNDEILVCVNGTQKTIIEKLETTLNEIRHHVRS